MGFEVEAVRDVDRVTFLVIVWTIRAALLRNSDRKPSRPKLNNY
jgi:hypothetical protein